MFPLWRISWSVMPMTLMAVMPSPGVRDKIAESLNRDLDKISEWCEDCGMKLKTSKTKTMIGSKSRTMNPQSFHFLLAELLKESDDLVILGVAFDSIMAFEKHLRSVSRAVSQRLGILRKFWQVIHDGLLLGGCFRRLSCPFWSTVLQCGDRLPYTP